MKAFALICFLFLTLEHCYCWAQDSAPDASSKHVFHFLYVNGQGKEDAIKTEKLRKIFLKFEDTLSKNIGKWKRKHGDDIPNLLKFIMKGNEKLGKELKLLMKKNVPETHHANFLKKLNKFLSNLSNGKVESIHFFRNAVGVKVNKSVQKKKIGPVQYEDHSAVMIPTRNHEKKKIKHMKKILQKHIKTWTQPSFMQFDDKSMIKKRKNAIPLSVFTSPGQVILPVKSEVLVNCMTTSKSMVNVQWMKDTKTIPSYVEGRVNGNTYVFPNGSLYIRSLRKRDIGIYQCVASTRTEKQYATAVVAVAYLQHFVPIDPVLVLEGNTEVNINCIPPYGVPPPTVTWKKNGNLINDSRYFTDSWTLVIKDVRKSDAGNYTCIASNMARQRNTTTSLKVLGDPVTERLMTTSKPEGESIMEKWVAEHFTKPHHLSRDEDDKKLQDIKSELDTPDGKQLQKELEQNGIGKTLLKGLLEERNDLPWADNGVLSKLTAEQKKDYLEAERKWEMKLTQETQRLLDKLQPADAYVIPDVPVYEGGNNGDEPKKLKGEDVARVIQEELEDVAQRKLMLTGNENWDAVDKPTKQNSGSPLSDISKKDVWKMNIKKKSKNRLDGESFVNKLADEEEQWIGVEKDAWSKIRDLEKFLKKLQH